jgi:maltooligosyltrehalose trehalohydrolase
MYAVRRWPASASYEPNSAATFGRCKLDHGLRRKGRHALLQSFYKRLYALRREHPALAPRDRQNLDLEAREETQALVVRRRAGAEEAFFVLHFGKKSGRLRLELPGGGWTKLLDSAQPHWGGPGSPAAERLAGGPMEISLAPHCVVVYGRSSSQS